jgi:thioredoxin reductase (NADPH)
MKSNFVTMTQSGETYESKTVIVASGVDNLKEIDGETEFLGRGVSYCATCDGFLYKDKTIAVLCTSKDLEHEITYLANFAKKVYVIPLYKNPQITAENAEIIVKKPIAIEGGMKVEKIVFSRLETAELKEISVDGMFILKESVSPSALVAGIETDNGHVKIQRDCSTNLKGCFAAGDCTGRPYQYAKAVGEGNVAAHSVSAYLAAQNK